MSAIGLGTEIKYGIRIPPIDGIPMSSFDFEVETYVYQNRKVTYKKSDTQNVMPLDDDSYKIIVPKEDMLKIGRGVLLAKVTCHIPDNDFPDGLRTEVYDKLHTGWVIT